MKFGPMAEIVNLQELKQILSTRESKDRIVLTGGCFDILHIGHIRFLSQAKAMGDYLVVLLESDRKVKDLKGKSRPVFVQKERAEMLSANRSVDLVVLLPTMKRDSDYLDLVMKIKPDIIAITENDPKIKNKRRQAREIGAKLKIIPLIKTFSTSKLVKLLGVE